MPSKLWDENTYPSNFNFNVASMEVWDDKQFHLTLYSACDYTSYAGI